MFDFFFKRKPLKLSEALGRPMPVAGVTVPQEWYDMKEEELIEARQEVEQWKGEWAKSQKKLTTLEGEVVSIRKYLKPFGSMDSFDGETDSTVQLARNVREQLDVATKTIKRLSMEAEQLQDQLNGSENVKLAYQLAQANETIEVWKDRAQHWKEKFDEANHLIEVLQAQVDTLNAKPAPRRKKVQDA